MKLTYFSARMLEWLRANAAANVAMYEGSSRWVEQEARRKHALLESSLIVDPPPQLLTSETNNARNDAENAQRVFGWLRSLTPTLAMEERLWAYLTHIVFAEYMHARWPAEKADAVTRRYLFEGKASRALSRNGIARLWWAAYLTEDAGEDDPFVLTRVLFRDQNIQVALLERNIGKCPRVRAAFLKYIRDNETALASGQFGRRIQILTRELNLLGGVYLLDALPHDVLRAHIEDIAKRSIFTASE